MNFTPKALTPPHQVTRPEQVDALANDMLERGWQGPPLVGYRLDGGVQLLSGTHRRAAAERINLAVPVEVYSWDTIRQAWGDLDKWRVIMQSDQNNTDSSIITSEANAQCLSISEELVT